MYISYVAKALLFTAVFSQLSIFTADCLRHPIQMAGVETIWELHTLSVIYSCFNIDTISYQGVLLSTVIVEPSHVVTLTHSTIQNGSTALKSASFNGHHKVAELLLGAGANPDLQDKVRIPEVCMLT